MAGMAQLPLYWVPVVNCCALPLTVWSSVTVVGEMKGVSVQELPGLLTAAQPSSWQLVRQSVMASAEDAGALMEKA